MANTSNIFPSGGVSDSSHNTSENSINLTPDSSPNIGMINQKCLETASHSGSMIVTPSVAASKEDAFQKRRSSSRSIKRRKFDDELVESSILHKTPRNRPPSGSLFPFGTPGLVPSVGVPGEPFSIETPAPLPQEKKKTSKSSSKRVKKSKKNQSSHTKNIGRWKPTDDLALILAVQQTNDLTVVYKGVKFSCKFTLQDIQERWYALLYDPVISKVAVTAMRQLHPDIVAQVQAKSLFNKDEEKLLSTINSTSQPTVETFQELLDQHPDVFLVSRTAKALFTHWSYMKQYHLLPDQTVQPLPRGEHVLNFSDAEDMLDDSELQDERDEALEQELALSDRRIKREIRQLENELPKWQVLVDSITGVTPQDFDTQTLAVLRGRLVRYLMRSPEISLGRASKDNSVDVDLSLEGPAWKVSRRQGMIRLRNNGEFFISNEGKRSIFVDGKPVLSGSKYRLSNNCVVEIAGLRFTFLVNQDLVDVIRNEAVKAAPWTSS